MTAAPEFTPGQEVVWTGTKGLFSRPVEIREVRVSYLAIFGETPADARTVCDIYDPSIGSTVLGIPAGQLHPRADEKEECQS